MTSERSRSSRMACWLGVLGAVLLLGGATGAATFYWAFVRDLPDLTTVADYEPALASHVYDRKGRAIGSFFTEQRQITPFEEIPEIVIQAFVAAEDASFFEHEGIDFKAILRAAWANLSGQRIQGASTITQQTVKTLLLTPERTYRRKIREVILARRLEQHFTKQEILFLYLNQIYFGHGAYGIGAAARSYFDKGVADLEVDEVALLAGLPKAPSKFSPFRNPERAELRRQYVLRRMHEEGYIDEATLEMASTKLPTLVAAPPSATDFAAAAYFTEQVRRYLFDALGGDRVLTGGLRIETTLDIELQKAAVAAVQKGVVDLDQRQGYRGPLRKIERDAIDGETLKLGIANGLVDAPEESDEEAGIAHELAAAVAEVAAVVADTDPLPRARERLSQDEPVLGVVIEVSRAQQLARVALAPDTRGTVHLEDVVWARPPNPQQRGVPVKQITAVFSVGDVARFRAAADHDKEVAGDARPAAGEEKGAEEEIHLTLNQDPIVQAALFSLDVSSGDVIALVGGYDFESSEFDRVTQARRQPGSAYKPLIYGSALGLRGEEDEHVWTPASIVHDRPKVYEDRSTGFVWKPENYTRSFYGPITLRWALAKSINNAAVHLADEVGVDAVISYSRKLNIESPIERSLAVALGSNEVSLLELTRAYAVFPAGGRRVTPRFIRRVLDREGNVLIEDVALGAVTPRLFDENGERIEPETQEEPQQVAEVVPAPEDEPPAEDALADEPPADPNQLIPAEDAFLMADMLRAVVQDGTGWRLKQLGRPLGGKTGTTNDQADAWFIGFSPDITTGVWVGHDESRFLGFGETGSRAAAPIWVDYMRVALEGRPVRDFVPPESIVFTRIDKKTGLLASSHSTETVFQPFIAGTEPTVTTDTHRTTEDALRDLREDSFSTGGGLSLMQLDSF